MKQLLFLCIWLLFLTTPVSAAPADPQMTDSFKKMVQQEWNQAKTTYKGIYIYSRLNYPPYEYTKLTQQLDPDFKIDVQKTAESPYSHTAVIEFRKNLLFYTAKTRELMLAEQKPKNVYTDAYILTFAFENNQWILKESKRYSWVFERWLKPAYTSLFTAAKYDL